MAFPLLSGADVLQRGLELVGIRGARFQNMQQSDKHDYFHAHYGSNASTIADMWHDMRNTNIQDAQLQESEINDDGFKMFMVAHYFLWVHPKNSYLTSSRFDVKRRQLQGDEFWKWVRKIAALREAKIQWDEDELGDDDGHIYIVSIDGVDCVCWETKHPEFSVDPGMYSHKYKHAGLRYLVVLDIWHSKCVYIDGPAKPGEVNDIDHFRSAVGGQPSLKDLMNPLPGKMLIADRGYRTSEPDEVGMVSIPSDRDPPELREFKGRVRARHEAFNGKLKKFKILQDEFRFSMEKHKWAFEAVCVILQYQLDDGTQTLFDP